MQEFWNQRYRQDEPAYGLEPNAFFKEQLKALQPGSLLMPAEGEGRDSVYAVATGWQEQAFTVRRALRKPYNWPMKHKVKMNYILYAAETYNSETERFDALALIYAHFPPATRHH